jgi:hypothetical protein
MRPSGLALAGALTLALGWTSAANAQGNMNSFGGYPTPLPYNQAPGSYVVAPSMPGSGVVYGYVTQNLGARQGMSPTAYYSPDFFTSTPMSRNAPYAYSYGSGYTGYAAPRVTKYTTPYATTYSPAYANSTRYYYSGYTTNRGGLLRRLFGGR